MTWEDDRPGDFATHVTGAGVVDGPPAGLDLSGGYGVASDFPGLVSDSHNGAIFVWADNRNAATSGYDVFAQHLLTAPFGVDPSWPANGAPVSTASGDQGGFYDVNCPLAPNGGGVVAVFSGSQSTQPGLYAQVVRPDGSLASSPSTVTASAGPGGSISPSGAQTSCNTDPTFTITPDPHYHVADVLVDGNSVGAVTSYTFHNLLTDHTIVASFAIDTYTINASAGSGGSIGPSGGVTVNYGADQGFAITPSTGYHVADVLVDGSSVGAVTSYTFSNVTANHTIAASFAINTYTINASAGSGGSIGPNGAVTVSYGADQGFTITASTGYHVADVLVDGSSVGAVASYTFSTVTANHTIAASFALNASTITATAGAGGTIGPDGAVTVNNGANQGFTITPNTGYHVADVLVDGSSVGAVTSYTFSNVTANHTIAASFAINTYTINASAGSGGTITPSGAVIVNYGASQQFTVTPATCQLLATLTVDGSPVLPATAYTFASVTANHTIAATFAANPAPTAAITAPVSGTVVPVGTAVFFSGTFNDNAGDTHTASWSLDALPPLAGTVDEGAKTVSASYTFTAAGVYMVKLTVTDQCGGSATATQVGGFDAMVVVYDPNAGFVTGGGWINSPAGAYTPNPSLVGKANFGFVSRYEKGKTVPTGNTEFQFKVANLDFHSTSYDWLVISGAKAQYRGSGTINGSGDYKFTLTAIDGDLNGGHGVDKFRMKITDTSSGVVYDNQQGDSDNSDPTTALGGGSVVIHPNVLVPSENFRPSATFENSLEASRPNPLGPNTGTEIGFSLAERSKVSLVVYDLGGRVVRRLVDAELEAGAHVAEWSGRDFKGSLVGKGIYFVRMEVTGVVGGRHITFRERLAVL